ncbi:unnamed protein product [Prorocentrum cordatum]|uniref:Uncharacterized protein n=1 Tax=Prorocentrum cordatum TaxID=2364126 RepID=A0ABN9QUQ3_9DINO|nr:unnamed protein product [Polarella glacialis]
MGDVGAACLAAALKKNTALRTTLLMRSGDVTARGAVDLAGALAENSSLEALDISTNEIGDEGAEAFASALGGNRTVVRLDMFGCEAGPRSEAAVRAALQRNREAAEGAAPVVADA